jgi:hypothetical protein
MLTVGEEVTTVLYLGSCQLSGILTPYCDKYSLHSSMSHKWKQQHKATTETNFRHCAIPTMQLGAAYLSNKLVIII